MINAKGDSRMPTNTGTELPEATTQSEERGTDRQVDLEFELDIRISTATLPMAALIISSRCSEVCG